MRKILAFLALLITYNVVCAQTTIVNQIQVKTGVGAPPTTQLPANGGIAYYDASGYIKKSTVASIIGSKIDTMTKINDTTIQIVSYGVPTTIKILGLYDYVSKGFVDSLRFGLKKDTIFLSNVGTGQSIGAAGASLQLSTFLDSTDVGFAKHSDGTMVPYLKAPTSTGSSAGDATHVAQVTIDAKGRVKSLTSVAITGVGGGTKKTINPQNANYTLVGADSTTYITVNRSTNDTIYVPDDGTVAMGPPVNMDIYQLGTGKVCFLPLNGSVTVNAPYGKNRTGAQYSKASLNKISANTWIVGGQLDTASTPYLTTSLSTLPSISTNSGIASTSDSLTVSGAFLTAGATVSSGSTNFQVSTDNSTWITYPTTISLPNSGTSLTGQPVKIYVRIPSSASTGSISSNVSFASSGATTIQVPISGTVNTTTQQAYFNFASTRTIASGSQPIYGDPTLGPVFADSVNGTMWTVSLIGSQWVKYGGFYGGSGNGANAASSDAVFTQAMGSSNMYTQTSFSTSSPNWNIVIGNGGELPAGTYQIEIWCSMPYNTFNMQGSSEFWVQFGSGSLNVALSDANGATPGTGTVNLTPVGPGTTGVLSGTFTGTITAGQHINICASKGTGAANTPQTGASAQLGIISAIFIKKIS